MITSFVTHRLQYDQWFEEHVPTYVSELLALRPFVPPQGRGLEIGVGTARFAAPLGVRFGVDPALEMLSYAARRGVGVASGTAEALPFRDGVFDYVLVVTTICFVDSLSAMLDEARRVLRPGGALVIAFIDRTSELGRHYEAHRKENPFYREATFYSAPEVREVLRSAGFTPRGWAQTLSGASPVKQNIEPARPGFGQGAFVVVHANTSDQLAQATLGPPAPAAHHASNCRWAMPTLFLPAPYWWNAEACPWACLRERVPRVLETTEVCADCPYWEAHPKARPSAAT